MLDIHYNLTTYNSYLKEMAAGFSAAYGEDIGVKDNKIVFPKALAEGRLECYDIDTGLALVIMDCTFFEDIRFVRAPSLNSYFHAMSFNLIAFSVMINSDGEDKTVEGESWKNKIFYSTAETSLSWIAPKNIPMKMIVLLLSREWIINKYKLRTTRNKIVYHEELLKDAPLQFTLDFDLETLLLTQEIITEEPPVFLSKLFYKGSVKRLLALALEREAGHLPPKAILKYQDVINIIEVKKQIEDNLNETLPTLDRLSKTCKMSPSKFANMFKAVYGKNYFQFFQETRILKAASLLQKNWEIFDAAKSVGFVNQSHFARLFKEYFKVTPTTYRENVKKY